MSIIEICMAPDPPNRTCTRIRAFLRERERERERGREREDRDLLLF
jgi:hypothetical protein